MWEARLSGGENLLQRQFACFHTRLHEAVAKIESDSELAVLIFSDSVFIATTSAEDCIAFCQNFMNECLSDHVPVRIGVGHGTFITNVFAYESTQRLRVITTQFLGTGVVYATDAEKAIKGMRIALHPSAVGVLKSLASSKARCYELIDSRNLDNATHEWNYVPAGRFDGRHGWALVKDRVEAMRAKQPPDPEKLLHYDSTLAALQRMRPVGIR